MPNMDSAPPSVAAPPPSRRRILLRLFLEYVRISLCVVGGGYAIIVAADEVFGKRLKWLREGELLDRLPVFQMIPGLIAGNSAAYVGLKMAGLAGVAVAMSAVALPSFVVILAVAHGYGWLPMGNPWLQGAFLGLRAALAGIVFGTMARTWPRVMRGAYPYVALAACLVLVLWFRVNAAWTLVGGMLCGIALELARPRRGDAPPPPAGGRTVLEAVGARAFDGCRALERADAVARHLGENAFRGCSALREVRLGAPVVPRGAFADCPALATVRFADPVAVSTAAIGPRAFAGCSALAEIALPGTLHEIGDEAFAGCTALRSVRFGDGLRRIGDRAFADSSLAEWKLPSWLCDLGAGALGRAPERILFTSGAPPLFAPDALEALPAGCALFVPARPGEAGRFAWDDALAARGRGAAGSWVDQPPGGLRDGPPRAESGTRAEDAQ